MKVLPYGEDGAYVDLEAGDAPDRAPRTHALAAALRAAFPDADVVTGAGVVAVFGAQASAVETTLTGLRVTSPDAYTSSPDAYTSPRNVYASSPNVYTSTVAPRSHVIDVAYDGPDLDDIAARTGLSRAAVIDLHTGREHVVELIGFLPGFAYMGPVDPRLVLPRRPAPRPRVEAGTVAIAGAFTGIYPLASPGGWNLLGASHGPRPFDPSRADPFLFSPGDRVRFRSSVSLESVAPPVSPAAPAASAPHAPSLAAPRANPAAHALIIARAAGIATLQDAGRTGLLGKGMPPSGPLDPPLFLAANRAAGNPPGAAAIELLAGSLVLRARGTVGLSIDGAPARALREGEELHIPEGPFAVRYIAVTGGIAVPLVLGARATLLTARIG
ncbi:MAG: carboxyltransferase domain-containing protein, partial [Polyangiaceae bacterium]